MLRQRHHPAIPAAPRAWALRSAASQHDDRHRPRQGDRGGYIDRRVSVFLDIRGVSLKRSGRSPDTHWGGDLSFPTYKR